MLVSPCRNHSNSWMIERVCSFWWSGAETVLQAEAHLPAEHRQGAGAGAVGLFVAVLQSTWRIRSRYCRIVAPGKSHDSTVQGEGSPDGGGDTIACSSRVDAVDIAFHAGSEWTKSFRATPASLEHRQGAVCAEKGLWISPRRSTTRPPVLAGGGGTGCRASRRRRRRRGIVTNREARRRRSGLHMWCPASTTPCVKVERSAPVGACAWQAPRPSDHAWGALVCRGSGMPGWRCAMVIGVSPSNSVAASRDPVAWRAAWSRRSGPPAIASAPTRCLGARIGQLFPSPPQARQRSRRRLSTASGEYPARGRALQHQPSIRSSSRSGVARSHAVIFASVLLPDRRAADVPQYVSSPVRNPSRCARWASTGMASGVSPRGRRGELLTEFSRQLARLDRARPFGRLPPACPRSRRIPPHAVVAYPPVRTRRRYAQERAQISRGDCTPAAVIGGSPCRCRETGGWSISVAAACRLSPTATRRARGQTSASPRHPFRGRRRLATYIVRRLRMGAHAGLGIELLAAQSDARRDR